MPPAFRNFFKHEFSSYFLFLGTILSVMIRIRIGIHWPNQIRIQSESRSKYNKKHRTPRRGTVKILRYSEAAAREVNLLQVGG
jgi:hypothetical protein